MASARRLWINMPDQRSASCGLLWMGVKKCLHGGYSQKQRKTISHIKNANGGAYFAEPIPQKPKVSLITSGDVPFHGRTYLHLAKQPQQQHNVEHLIFKTLDRKKYRL